MDRNRERQTTSRENQARAHVLSKEVQHLQEEKSRQVRTALPLTAEPLQLRGRRARLGSRPWPSSSAPKVFSEWPALRPERQSSGLTSGHVGGQVGLPVWQPRPPPRQSKCFSVLLLFVGVCSPSCLTGVISSLQALTGLWLALSPVSGLDGDDR